MVLWEILLKKYFVTSYVRKNPLRNNPPRKNPLGKNCAPWKKPSPIKS